MWNMVAEEYRKHEQDEIEAGICASSSKLSTHSCPKYYSLASVYEMIQPKFQINKKWNYEF